MVVWETFGNRFEELPGSVWATRVRLENSMKIAGKRILVTGGAGFIGSHLVDYLLREPISRIVVLDNFLRGSQSNLKDALQDGRANVVEGDVRNPGSLRQLGEFDYIVHLAGLWLTECQRDPLDAIRINIEGTLNVIKLAQKMGAKLVYASSASVYGNAIIKPMTEEHPFNNRSIYGATKIMGEHLLRSFHKSHELDYIALRCMTVYGTKMDYKGFYANLIMKALDQLESGEAPVIAGDPSDTFDFINVKDVARAYILAMKGSVTDEAINISSGRGVTLGELASLLVEITNSSQSPRFVPRKEAFVNQRTGSTEKAKRLLGFEAQVPLCEGLQELRDWRNSENPSC